MKKEVFIEKAVAIHGDKFDYSLLPDEFKTNEKLPVSCKKHGVWYVTTGNHISNKRGCPSCSVEKSSERNRSNPSEIIDRVKEVLSRTDKTLVHLDYINMRSLATVHCKLHGEYKQKVVNILNGISCYLCGVEAARESRSKNVEYYIPEFLKIHGDKYDYSKSSGVNSKTRFTIVCPIHGEFISTVSNHLKGKGCAKCGASSIGYKSYKTGTFYILKITDDIIKFGISNCPDKRINIIRTKCKYPVEVLHLFTFEDGGIARAIESEIICSDIIKGVIPSDSMKTGYTETTYAHNLDAILSIVDRYKPD